MDQPTLKRISGWESSFSHLRSHNLAYVDKTKYLEILENDGTCTPFIVRPRFFGKTFFTQTLLAYYDKSYAKDFDANFAGTYIAEHKTKLASSYRVLYLSLEAAAPDNLKDHLVDSLRLALANFAQRNNLKGIFEFLNKEHLNAQSLLFDFLSFYRWNKIEGRIFLIVDSYDYMAKEAFTAGPDAVAAVKKAWRTLRSFFESIKSEFDHDPLACIFIIGETAISLDGMVSGYNIAWYYTGDSRFAGLFGFTEDELRKLIEESVDLKRLNRSVEDIVSFMKETFCVYRFSSRSDLAVFNPFTTCRFLKDLISFNKIPEFTRELTVSRDITKLRSIFSLIPKPYVKEIVSKALSKEELYLGGRRVLGMEYHDFYGYSDVLEILTSMGYLTYAPKSSELVIPGPQVTKLFEKIYEETK